MPWCRNCGEYIYESTAALHGRLHQCPPEWELIAEDELEHISVPGRTCRPPEWTLVYAYDEEAAAEKWAEEYDCNGDYAIVGGSPAVVYTRKVADEDFIGPTRARRWSVSGESRPHYSADEEA